MKLTNHQGLPKLLVDAIRNDDYSRGDSDISVTQLIDSPQIRRLLEEYEDMLSEDVSDRVWALLGQSVHHMIERAARSNPSAIVERRLRMPVLDKILSGQLDYLEDGVLVDWKVTSAWTLTYRSHESWEAQLNVLAHLCEYNQLPVKELKVLAICRDWSPRKAADGSNYPHSAVVEVPFERWDNWTTQRYIVQRMALHFSDSWMFENPTGTQPECSDEERWKQPDTWAVMKKGRKSAIRVFDNEDDAEAHLMELAGDKDVHPFSVEWRRGRYSRCERYCPVRTVCPQWIAEQWDAAS